MCKTIGWNSRSTPVAVSSIQPGLAFCGVVSRSGSVTEYVRSRSSSLCAAAVNLYVGLVAADEGRSHSCTRFCIQTMILGL